MSNSNCCFLTCIQISQQAGQMVWYFHLFKNFSQFVVIHTVKSFDIVNKAEIDIFREFSCFFNDPMILAIRSLVPLPFLNPAWTSGISRFTYCWRLGWRILSITLATWCKELTHLKRPWCWEWLKEGGEGEDRGWDGWMASPTQWTWVWVNSRSWWWTGRPGVLLSVGSQRVGHDWATELTYWLDHRKGKGIPEKHLLLLYWVW